MMPSNETRIKQLEEEVYYLKKIITEILKCLPKQK